jgi:hypothetical protein
LKLALVRRIHPGPLCLSKCLDDRCSGPRPLSGELVIPAHALLSISRSLSTDYDITLLKPQEEENLAATLASMPDFELAPAQMMELFEALSATNSSSSVASAPASLTTSVPSARSSSDDFALDIESDTAETAEERRDTIVERRNAPSLGNLFDIRERSSPLDATPSAALKKRPRRRRGHSEITFLSLSGTDNNAVSCDVSASLVVD